MVLRRRLEAAQPSCRYIYNLRRCVSALLGALANIGLQGGVDGSSSSSDSGSESGGHEASSMLLPTPPVPTPQLGGRSRVAAARWGL